VAEKANLFGHTRSELERCAGELGLAAYRGRQLYRWIYSRSATDFDSMTDLPRGLRAVLAEHYTVCPPAVVGRHDSRDGTVKFLFGLENESKIEAVYIPDNAEDGTGRAVRHTICLSTQVGCPLKCTFCYSGTVPFVRNLTAGEILGQFGAVSKALLAITTRVNVVFMGMGEPLLNSGAVLSALAVLTDPDGFAVSPRRITVSTAGLAEELERFAAAAPPVGLAVSLHATTDDARDRMMPINRKYPLEELLQATRRLPLPRRRRITFEYVLLGGENDSEADARRLARLLKGIPAKVNLIAYNPWPGSSHRASTDEATERFLGILLQAGYTASLRRSRGDDILAACGQLAGEPELGEA
jgi:23S rRNA (adenine2503-C2)-methyltransferase